MGIGSSPVASEGSRGGGAPLGSLYRRAGSGSAAAYISPHYTGDRSLVLYLQVADMLEDEAPASSKTTPGHPNTGRFGFRGQFAVVWSSWRQNVHLVIDQALPVKASL